ncbi:hypothetical protein AYJ57_20830 (plasmid) [Salipiger sp. CCB-MM3]|nr:hypothetical protein AYJ57_20830 [Salipiger sp. CCB-MM3]
MLHQLSDMVGIEHFTYLRINTEGQLEDATESTYSDEWQNRYISGNYQLIDPVVQIGLKSALPIDWSQLTADDPAIRDFFGEAAEFGVSSQGLTIPIRDAQGRRALFSINSNMSASEFGRYTNDFRSDIHYLGYLFHEHSCRNSQFEVPCVPLSSREQGVLFWAARGKTAKETGLILDLKESTVKFYTHNAAAKLGASNKTHAVAKAIGMGIITL